LGYWKHKLSGAPASLELPTDGPRPPEQTFHGAKHTISISSELVEQLKFLSRKEGVTFFMTLLSAFTILLSRYSGQDDIVVGSPIAGRTNAAVEKLIARTVEEFGQLDVAVSNAAYSDRELFFQADMAGFRRTVDVTMWGAFYLMRAATQQMIKQGKGGAICIVSSPHAFIPAPRAMAYNMSKAAIEHMARTAAIEVAEYRIRINLIQPGWTDTPGELKFASRETLDSAGAKIPLGRLGTAEEMAEGILFLSSPRNEYITGAALLVDGGISLPWWANRGSAAPA
jgi:glucose 1-dehydrogenase